MAATVGGESHIVRSIDGDEHRAVPTRKLEYRAILRALSERNNIPGPLRGMPARVRDGDESMIPKSGYRFSEKIMLQQ
jgi:hypothetical protein